MGTILTNGASDGVTSSDVTAVLAHVLAGETALTSDSNDEVGVGTMTVNSLLSFSCAAYSGRRVLAKWQNPKAATGKPYSGVIIRYSTSGYPGKTGGTQIYKGAGSNTSSEGQSQTYLNLPNLNTTYYLSIYPYVTCSAGEMIGEVRNATVKTSAQINLTIKGTQNYTIPVGYTKMDIFCVGAGGSGAFDSKSRHGGGGGGAWSAGNASAGGAGGGGAGGYGSQKGANGGTNTGGGGGGDGSAKTGYSVGGSGIVLIRLK